MTSSIHNVSPARARWADGLTLARLLVTPVIMLVIVSGWPDNGTAVLASALFAIAAFTDIADNFVGGSEFSSQRKMGWFDDIADIVLVIGTLLAMLFVVQQNGMLTWTFWVPVALIAVREIIVGAVKGRDLQNKGWPVTHFGNLKIFLMMLATCILVAAPWLTTLLDSVRANEDTVFEIYNSHSAYVWVFGEITLWVAAFISLFTGFRILTRPAGIANDH